jgi:hypothetical protein
MRSHSTLVRRVAATAAIPLALLLSAPASRADEDLQKVINTGDQTVQDARASQERIDRMVGDTEGLERQYRQTLKEIDGLEVYTDYMDRQLRGQDEEMENLRDSINRVSAIERQMMPLMMRMLEGLETFVKLDVPFLPEERVKRIDDLKAVMERSDVTVAEKFRRLMEAFQVENDYGRTIEAYEDTLQLSGSTLEVNLLRIGRVGLYFQTSDFSVTGMWDRAKSDWLLLDDEQSRYQVRQGLKMAGRQVAPDLLLLPVDAPEES